MFEWLRRKKSAQSTAAVQVHIPMGVWIQVQGDELAQGDHLSDCFVPKFPADFGTQTDHVVPVSTANLIVLTQSCDLENKKVDFVALCPIHTLDEFEEVNSQFKKKGAWEEVRKGRHEGLHLFPSPTIPEDNRHALVADFRHVISLPLPYLTSHAEQLGLRWRVQSPFLEHFSQAFARFFMRVGLPSAIPPFPK